MPFRHKLAAQITPRRVIIASVLLVLGVAGLLALSLVIGGLTREPLIRTLRQHYHADVELRSLAVSLFPLGASGEGLVLHYRGKPNLAPLISVEKFKVRAGVLGLLRKPRRIRLVELEGLRINIIPGAAKPGGDEEDKGKRPPDFNIDQVHADGTVLKVFSKKPDKPPLVWDIHKLKLRGAGTTQPMEFDAVLRNAKPPGDIVSQGHFGPWQAEDPGHTPVSGDYLFEKADLGVFHGIFGILSSRGKYHGRLDRMDVQGYTDMPNFGIEKAHHPVHLRTQFSAVVDGTNGDTRLDPVIAKFLHTTVVARGDVFGTPGVKGKSVGLDVTIEQGRVEDLIHLASPSSDPVMSGDIVYHSTFLLPAGPGAKVQKMRLEGQFAIRSAEFSKGQIQEKINQLSLRARGEKDKTPPPDAIASDFSGQFKVAGGLIHFSQLGFTVPGAVVSLHGTYAMKGGAIDMQGTARLQAKPSEMATGMKSFFLKALNPLLKGKNAGTELPIKVTGTFKQPHFGIRPGKLLSKK